MSRVYIVAAGRTPFGRFRGQFSQLSPVHLATVAATAILESVGGCEVDQVIVGNVLSAGHGMNIARQMAVQAGLPLSTPAFTVNMMCGSGLQSALLGAQAIRSGDSNVVLVGGVESMSQSAMLVPRPAKGQSASVDALVDSMQRDGLVDSFSHRHMAETAEILAREIGISRSEQDAWAVRSQRLYAAALKEGHLSDEMISVGGVSTDEHPRPDVNQDSLSTLKPIFDSDNTITAGNSSGINDGAAMILLASESAVKKHRWKVMAEWQDAAVIGCDPQRMGLGPVYAIQKLLHRTGRTLQEIDTLEINEAFAAQTLACLRQLEITNRMSRTDSATFQIGSHAIRVNPHGGAIAIGHPLAASGARLLTHLAWQTYRKTATCSIASLCIGGGMGIAALLTASQSRPFD